MSGVTKDYNRYHKTLYNVISTRRVSKKSQDYDKIWPGLHIGARIQNLRLMQFESTLKIIMVRIENSSFGYNLTIGNLVKRGCLPLLRDGGECFAPHT